jgi:hypothetical protein
MADLFARGPLEQETGLLRERWGQEGSTIVNASISTTIDATVVTVTAGKVIYINSLLMSCSANAATNSFVFKDGDTGTIVFRDTAKMEVGGNLVYNFPTPLKFETSVYFDGAADITWNINMQGWEEAL